MERYEIGGDERLAALVEAAERGEEAVFTRSGEVVAAVKPRVAELRTRDGGEPQRGIDWELLRQLHDSVPSAAQGGGAALVREIRDMDEH